VAEEVLEREELIRIGLVEANGEGGPQRVTLVASRCPTVDGDRGHPIRSETSDITWIMTVTSSAPFRLPTAPVATDLVAKYFRGLGDPSRLRILELLRDEGELSVGELVERLGLSQPKVSNHLACLRWCGFIDARRVGRTVYNRIGDERVAAMLDLAGALLADNATHVAVCCRIEEPVS
jgi:DNA-binding transcriptional ArsR family regulator